MDKSKILAVGALVVLGGILFYAKGQDPAAPSHDDDDDHAPTPTATVAPAVNAKPPTGHDTGAVLAPLPQSASEVTKLQTTDERVGDGPVAKPGDKLSMNYKGTLLNGKVFDQSYGRAPFEFQLGAGQVISGWDQGIAGMKAGGKRRLIIPADLAYGAESPSPDIPPNSPLVFEVELLSVNGKS